MVNSRGDSRLDGLEKATKELNAQFQQTNERLSALGSKLDSIIEEMRAGFAALNHKSRAMPEDGASSENRECNSVSAGNKSTSPMPTFDGSEPLAWLARANQYFLINKTSSDRRVDVAMLAIDGPAKPWKQLLVRRCPSLSWDKFVQELLQRFGDTITSESCFAGNSSKYSSKDPFSTVYVAKNQPKIPPRTSNNSAAILPTVTAPLLSSSLSTTALPEIPPITTSTIHPDINTKADNRTPLPLVVQQPIHISVLVPLPSPTNPPTPTVVTTPLWFASADISLFQPFFPLLRRTVPAAAAELATIMYLPLLIHGHIPWFSFAPPVQKHEWEPPPNKVIGLNFELNLEDKVVLRVRQLIRTCGSTGEEIGRWFGQQIRKISKRVWQEFSKLKVRKWGSNGSCISSKSGQSSEDIEEEVQQTESEEMGE